MFVNLYTYSSSSLSTTFWFLSGRDIRLYGGGTLDGNGQVWWDTFNISKVFEPLLFCHAFLRSFKP